MFTGIVEEVGRIAGFVRDSRKGRLTVACSVVLDDASLGDSIAVNGVCLTVVEKDKNSFSADATDETLSRSTLKDARPGHSVNLERAVKLSTRMGGHLVQGHVDTVGTIVSDEPRGDSLLRTIRLSGPWMRYVAEKGSITVDGISLTVSNKGADRFTVAVIPESLKRTTLSEKRVGQEVNIEVDIIAKYVESLFGKSSHELTVDKMKEYGF